MSKVSFIDPDGMLKGSAINDLINKLFEAITNAKNNLEIEENRSNKTDK